MMFRSPCLKGSAALAVMGLALSVLPAAEKVVSPKPTLVLKGKHCFIHALPFAPEPTRLRADFLPTGLQLLHTLSETGEMRLLLTSGTRETVGPERALRLHYTQTRIVGVAGDADRLYVVTWTSSDLRDPPSSTADRIKGGSYRLDVFWLVDGSQLTELQLTSKALPETSPRETTDNGSLEVGEKEVTCYGLTISVRGKEIGKPTPKG
jgi:hypothetical protein